MSNTGKITFGNNAATTYSAKQIIYSKKSNTNFGYVSGDNVGGSYSPYSQQQQPLSTTINAVSAAGYGSIQQQRSTSPTIQRSNVGQSLLNTYTSGQTVTPVTTSFQNKPIPISSPQGGKITFGGKQFTSQFTPQTRYESTTNYVAQPINNYQTYQTYQSYQRPVEIAPVIATQHIQSQPIREEVQVVQQKYQQPIVQRKSSKVETTPYRESTSGSTSVKKSKKGGCPAWLWPMLGILALLALILGLLFGLGVFGRIGGSGANVQKQGQVSPVAGANVTTPTTTVDTTSGVSTTQQPQGGYTVIDETVVVSKNDTTTTTGVTSPTVVDTTYTTVPVVPVTTVDTTYTSGVPTATTTTVSEDEFAIDPASFAPTPVATTNTQYYTTSSTVPTTTYSTDSTVYTTTPYAAGTTYPTVSGYGSNPEFQYVQPTTSAQ